MSCREEMQSLFEYRSQVSSLPKPNRKAKHKGLCHVEDMVGTGDVRKGPHIVVDGERRRRRGDGRAMLPCSYFHTLNI